MKLYVRPSNIASALITMFAAATTCMAGSGSRNLIEIESGVTTFYASTNVPGVEVKGKSTALSGQVEVSEDANGLVLQRIEASAPVKSLGTGMKVRDEHMRKYIFTTADGQEPNLVFAADQGACRSAGNGYELRASSPGVLVCAAKRARL